MFSKACLCEPLVHCNAILKKTLQSLVFDVKACGGVKFDWIMR